jgi:hypothetical protein
VLAPLDGEGLLHLDIRPTKQLQGGINEDLLRLGFIGCVDGLNLAASLVRPALIPKNSSSASAVHGSLRVMPSSR